MLVVNRYHTFRAALWTLALAAGLSSPTADGAEPTAPRGLETQRFEVATDGLPSRGPADAPIEVVVFSDFQCPYCDRIRPVLDEAEAVYGDDLRLVFQQFPLHSIHPNAQKAAEASLCAHRQGKFWEMHDALFERQRELLADDLKARARELGLDGERFDACLDGGETRAEVEAGLIAGQRAGVRGTPSVYVNGRPVRFVRGVPLVDQLRKVIDEEPAAGRPPARR